MPYPYEVPQLGPLQGQPIVPQQGQDPAMQQQQAPAMQQQQALAQQQRENMARALLGGLGQPRLSEIDALMRYSGGQWRPWAPDPTQQEEQLYTLSPNQLRERGYGR